MSGWRKWVAAMETGAVSIADLISVCYDSNYNLNAIDIICRTRNRAAFIARRIDDECREHSIIYLFKNKKPQ